MLPTIAQKRKRRNDYCGNIFKVAYARCGKYPNGGSCRTSGRDPEIDDVGNKIYGYCKGGVESLWVRDLRDSWLLREGIRQSPAKMDIVTHLQKPGVNVMSETQVHLVAVQQSFNLTRQ